MCPCGRSHPDTRPFRAPARKPDPELNAKVYAALVDERAHQGTGSRWIIAYQGDCRQPLQIGANDLKRTFAVKLVRCRVCSSCRRARTNYWAYAAMEQSRLSEEAGLRTWFGTLTLAPDWQQEFLDRARARSQQPNAEWWADPHCDQRFAAVRDLLREEVQRFWKRLRRAGHQFKYLVVFERHQSGLPHMHFLLHERGSPIRKRDIQSQWPFGFSNCSVVGGRSRKAASPERAAYYVCKYLSKSIQARQLASLQYKPMKRPKLHSERGTSSRVSAEGGGVSSRAAPVRARDDVTTKTPDPSPTNDDATTRACAGVSCGMTD